MFCEHFLVCVNKDVPFHEILPTLNVIKGNETTEITRFIVFVLIPVEDLG